MDYRAELKIIFYCFLKFQNSLHAPQMQNFVL